MKRSVEWTAPQEEVKLKRRSLLAWLAIGVVVLLSLSVPIYMESDHDSAADQLQNQSAAEIMNILMAADFPIKEPVVVNVQSDPNHLMGTPGGYISKAEWIDTRGAASIRSTVTVEVFQNSKECRQRQDALEKLYAYVSSDGYYYFSEGKVLIAVQKGITKTQASIYGEALEAIKNGEMPKNH